MRNLLRSKSAKITLPILGGALGVMLVLGWWFGLREPELGVVNITGSKPGYTSIESLSDASDVVVIGTVNRIAGRETVYTTDGDDLGFPSVFYEVEVQERLQGNPANTIIVAQIDTTSTEVVFSDAGSPLNVGGRLALFLLHRVGNEYGLEEFGDIDNLYVIVSDDNGMFDVSADEIATPREPYLFRTEGGPETPTFTLDQIRAGVGVVTELPSGADADVPGGLLEAPPASASPVSAN